MNTPGISPSMSVRHRPKSFSGRPGRTATEVCRNMSWIRTATRLNGFTIRQALRPVTSDAAGTPTDPELWE